MGVAGPAKRPDASVAKAASSTPTGQSAPTPPVAKNAGTVSVLPTKPVRSIDVPMPMAAMRRGRVASCARADADSAKIARATQDARATRVRRWSEQNLTRAQCGSAALSERRGRGTLSGSRTRSSSTSSL
jgi:hypothetical protein